jgi:hypothetical protein
MLTSSARSRALAIAGSNRLAALPPTSRRADSKGVPAALRRDGRTDCGQRPTRRRARGDSGGA